MAQFWYPRGPIWGRILAQAIRSHVGTSHQPSVAMHKFMLMWYNSLLLFVLGMQIQVGALRYSPSPESPAGGVHHIDVIALNVEAANTTSSIYNLTFSHLRLPCLRLTTCQGCQLMESDVLTLADFNIQDKSFLVASSGSLQPYSPFFDQWSGIILTRRASSLSHGNPPYFTVGATMAVDSRMAHGLFCQFCHDERLRQSFIRMASPSDMPDSSSLRAGAASDITEAGLPFVPLTPAVSSLSLSAGAAGAITDAAITNVPQTPRVWRWAGATEIMDANAIDFNANAASTTTTTRYIHAADLQRHPGGAGAAGRNANATPDIPMTEGHAPPIFRKT